VDHRSTSRHTLNVWHDDVMSKFVKHGYLITMPTSVIADGSFKSSLFRYGTFIIYDTNRSTY